MKAAFGRRVPYTRIYRASYARYSTKEYINAI